MVEPRFKSRQSGSGALLPKLPFIPVFLHSYIQMPTGVVLIAKRNSQEQKGNEYSRTD